MKETKRRLETFSLYDRTGLEKHLTQMAEKGWLLEKIGQFFWTYRKAEPQTLTFCVCYFPKASQFDPGPSEEQQTFYDFCEHTGWTLAASSAQLQVFYNERPHPIPIETDPVMELDAIHRTMKRSFLPSQLVLLLVAVLNGALMAWRLVDDPVEVLASANSLFAAMCWVMVAVLVGVECVGYFLWRRRAVRAAERGEFLNSHSHRKLQIAALVLLALWLGYYLLSVLASGDRMMIALVALMFLLYVPGLFLVINGVKGFLKRKKASAKVNRAVTIVIALAACYAVMGVIVFGTLYGHSHGWFAGNEEETYQYNGITCTAYHDELPLTVEDLLDVDLDGYSYWQQWGEESLLLGRYVMDQSRRFDAENRRELPDLSYTIVLVKAPFLYGLCRDTFLRQWEDDWYWDSEYVPADATPWGAVEAYRELDGEYGPRNQYLLCYPDRIVEIQFDYDWGEVTPEQMAVVGEKLGGWTGAQRGGGRPSPLFIRAKRKSAENFPQIGVDKPLQREYTGQGFKNY